MIPTVSNHLSAVEKTVLAALHRVDRNYLRLGRRSGNWTRAIKNAVGHAGTRYGCKAYAAECRFGRNGEWMFDLIWSREDNDYLFKLPLIMESEWYPKGILWDFSKLVAARAEHRLMVFWGRSPEQAKETIRRMVNQIHRFRGTMIGDRYLFCYWIGREDPLRSQLYVVKRRPTSHTRAPAFGAATRSKHRRRSPAVAQRGRQRDRSFEGG